MKTLAAFLVLVCSLLVLGPFLDGPTEQQAAEDVQADFDSIPAQLAAMEAELERDAARLCVRIEGPGATHRWSADYRLICTPSPVTQTKGSM